MVGCVLLIACLSVAEPVAGAVAFAQSRVKHPRRRSARAAGELLNNCLPKVRLLGLLGGLAGLVIAIWGIDSLKAFLPSIPRIDGNLAGSLVLVVTAIASVGVGDRFPVCFRRGAHRPYEPLASVAE